MCLTHQGQLHLHYTYHGRAYGIKGKAGIPES